MRRRLVGEMEKEWIMLEDAVYDEEKAWDKTYDDSYQEYMCYIEIPKVAEKITAGNSTILGSNVIYYAALGHETYAYGIFVNVIKISELLTIEKSGKNSIYGATGTIPLNAKKNINFSGRIVLAAMPKGTHISVYAR